MNGPVYQAPKSMHISREKYQAMIDRGWNRTVLPKYEYELGGIHLKLPTIPTYDDWANHCTCALKKMPLIKAKDT